MKKDVAKLWISALRSGKYVQGRGVLRRGDRYCVLGVLCDISGLTDWETVSSGLMSYYWEYASFPAEVASWSGLGKGLSSIVNLNDSGLSFELLAAYIDEHWGAL